MQLLSTCSLDGGTVRDGGVSLKAVQAPTLSAETTMKHFKSNAPWSEEIATTSQLDLIYPRGGTGHS